MLLSRTLARRRIASGTRPGFVDAWLPVLIDAAAITALLVLVWPLVDGVVYGAEASVGMAIAILFVVYFIPFQAVIILSAMWAAMSRWADTDGNGAKPPSGNKLPSE